MRILAGVALLALTACSGSPCPLSVSPPHPKEASSATTPAPRSPGVVAIDALLAEVSPTRLRATVEKLATFGTRHTLSETDSETRGIGAARRWIKAELERYAAASGRIGELTMQVSFDTHHYAADGKRVPKDVDVVNVMAVLPGASAEARARRYYVLGHYDSRATDVMDATSDAPGANDDASGVALVLELARVFSTRRMDATLVFLATAGEEQGLLGAKLHAEAAKAAGLDVQGVLNSDIVGDPSSPTGPGHPGEVRVFSAEQGEDHASRELARFVTETASEHAIAVKPVLIFRADRVLRGGDHLPFSQAGFPAVRFTTVDETYTRQHQSLRVEGGVRYGDTPDHVDPEYLAGVVRVNAAALAHLATAPAPPEGAKVTTKELSNDVLLRWSRRAGAAGYEVVWRPTTSATWSGARRVADVVELRLPMSKDDFFYGVRAVNAEGFASPAAYARPSSD